MVATLTKLGEGAFADVFGCQKEGWKKLAIKVHVCVIFVYISHVTKYWAILGFGCQKCAFHLSGI